MALCRCKIPEHDKPKGRKVVYIESVEPVGYPNSSSVCGRKDCENPGMIWLTKDEWKEYQKGEKRFSYASAVSRVKVK